MVPDVFSSIPSVRRKEATIVYYRQETGKFYTDIKFTTLLAPEVGKFYVDGNFLPKDEYYIYDTLKSIFCQYHFGNFTIKAEYTLSSFLIKHNAWNLLRLSISVSVYPSL